MAPAKKAKKRTAKSAPRTATRKVAKKRGRKAATTTTPGTAAAKGRNGKASPRAEA